MSGKLAGLMCQRARAWASFTAAAAAWCVHQHQVEHEATQSALALVLLDMVRLVGFPDSEGVAISILAHLPLLRIYTAWPKLLGMMPGPKPPSLAQ